MKIDYARYQTLSITRKGVDDAVLDIQMRATNGKLPTAGHAGHRELAEIWRDVSADDSVKVAVLRGEGLGFSGGGDLGLVQDMASDFAVRSQVWKEARRPKVAHAPWAFSCCSRSLSRPLSRDIAA